MFALRIEDDEEARVFLAVSKSGAEDWATLRSPKRRQVSCRFPIVLDADGSQV